MHNKQRLNKKIAMSSTCARPYCWARETCRDVGLIPCPTLSWIFHGGWEINSLPWDSRIEWTFFRVFYGVFHFQRNLTSIHRAALQVESQHSVCLWNCSCISKLQDKDIFQPSFLLVFLLWKHQSRMTKDHGNKMSINVVIDRGIVLIHLSIQRRKWKVGRCSRMLTVYSLALGHCHIILRRLVFRSHVVQTSLRLTL